MLFRVPQSDVEFVVGVVRTDLVEEKPVGDELHHSADLLHRGVEAPRFGAIDAKAPFDAGKGEGVLHLDEGVDLAIADGGADLIHEVMKLACGLKENLVVDRGQLNLNVLALRGALIGRAHLDMDARHVRGPLPEVLHDLARMLAFAER